ncbi:hypothetical protein E4T39_08066 [Aureobasidium subglaciale]|nr:hypothetical protein E4T39_08066 [Aureobasidium subglaciale]
MLRPLSARDASTCLQCNLRLVLRQIHQRRNQSSDQSPHLTLDSTVQAPAPAPEQDSNQNEQPGRISFIRTHGNHGRIRGRKGGQRRVESSESLSIASLGRSSDVIVLRDLHEPRPEKKPLSDYQHMQEDGTLEPKPRALTSRDIQELAGGRAIRPALAEVFESIDAFRPEEGVYIVTKSEYDAKFTAVAKAYNIAQLRSYLYQKTRPDRRLSSKSRKSNPTAVRRNNVNPTEISSSEKGLQTLTRTAWHSGTTPIEKRLPMDVFTVHTARKMNNKEYVIDSILRDVWLLGIEEEEAALGELEFVLSPMQFGLLLTKNSETLRPLLDSSKYYKNSRFKLYQADRVIRIVGPKAEAEAIAHILAEAYAPARSADMDLESFHAAMHSHPPGFNLHDVLTPQQLTNIMELTRTYINFDSDARRLRIASFVDTAINDAHRLIVALLPMDMRSRVVDLYDLHSTDECRLEPISTMKHLPSRHKHRLLGRWVTTSSKISSPDNRSPIQTNQGAEIFDSVGAVATATVPLRKDSPVIAKALELMSSFSEKQAVPPSPKYNIWPSQDETGRWKARIGQSLQDVQVTSSYPVASTLHPDVSKEHTQYSGHTFAPHFPSLVGLLARARPPIMYKANPGQPGGTELIAHLVPSPFEEVGCFASTAFPRIQLRFDIHDTTPTDDSKDTGYSVMPTPLPNGKWIVFSHMRANIATDIVSMHLPSQPADIIFERERALTSKYVARDARIRSFIETVHNSMANDTVLRAPPALEIDVPAHVVRTQLPNNESLKTPQNLRSNREHGPNIPMKYLFAGFEYREWSPFTHLAVEPRYGVMVETFEAGVAGGRRVELTLRPKRQFSKDVEDRAMLQELVDGSVNVLKILAGSQSGKSDLHTMTTPKLKKEETLEVSKLNPRKEKDTRGKPASKEKKTPRTEAKMPQDSNIANVERLQPEEVAHEEKQLELDTDQHPRTEEAALDELTRQQNSTPDSADGQVESEIEPASRADNEALENAISDSKIEVQALDVPVPAERSVEPVTHEIPSTSEPALSTREDATSEQASAQEILTASEQTPAEEIQEVETREEKAPEEEPLSVRLRRLMGGA